MSSPLVEQPSSPVVTPAPVESDAQRVLIVDGDPSTRSILEVSLRRSGFDVTTATSGNEAMLALATGRLPAVMVLSSDLQGEDGYSLCAQLRGEPRTEHLPVVLLARRDEEERLALAEAVGADDLVAKPAFARDIAALVVLRIAPKDANGFALDTSALALSWATRALLSAHRGGQIRLGEKAYIGFRNGRITHAEIDGASGMDALVRILALGRGPYRVQFTMPATAPMLEVSLRELVSGIFPRLAKWEQLSDRSVPLDQRFQVDFAALARALPTIPDAVNDVVRLFDGRRSVRQVLFDSPLNEIITLEVANRLHLMGVVRPVAAQEAVEELTDLKVAPRLFEPAPLEAVETMSSLFGEPRDFSDSIPTPPESPVVRLDVASPAADWYEAPQGTGLEPGEGEGATDGWQVQTGAAENIQAHLVAFNIQSEIEPNEASAAAADVAAFNEGQTPVDAQTPLEHAIAPIQLTQELPKAAAPTQAVAVRTLEESFFAEGESDDEADWARPTPPMRRPIEVRENQAEVTQPDLALMALQARPTAPALGQQFPQKAATVAEAVLGPDDEAAAQMPADAASTRLVAIAAGAVLLLALIGVAIWNFAGGDEAPAPVAVMAPAEELAPAAPVVHLDAPVEEAPVAVAEQPVSEALAAAAKLYESGRLKEALKALDAVVANEASSVKAWQLTGLARYDSGDTRGAEEAVMTVLALAPEYADAHLLLATIDLDSGKKTEAKAELQKYLDLDPSGPHADEAKALLRR